MIIYHLNISNLAAENLIQGIRTQFKFVTKTHWDPKLKSLIIDGMTEVEHQQSVSDYVDGYMRAMELVKNV